MLRLIGFDWIKMRFHDTGFHDTDRNLIHLTYVKRFLEIIDRKMSYKSFTLTNFRILTNGADFAQ